MKRGTVFLRFALLVMIICLSVSASAEGQFRPLPVDMSGGAPYTVEYSRDLLVYEDPSIRVERTLRTYNELINREYYAIDIVIQDASQLRTAPADPTTFVSERRVVGTTIAKRVNAILAINGDYCGDFHGHESSKYILRQGEVFRDTVDTRLDMLLIDEAGDFHIIKGSTELESLDKTQVDGKRVFNALQFGPALVIGGVPMDEEYIMDDAHSPQFAGPQENANRLCLLQMGPLHYKVIATRNYATMSQFKQLVLDVAPECINAYVLDGGGSTQVIFLGNQVNGINNETKQNIRKLSDIVYFASAWFQD